MSIYGEAATITIDVDTYAKTTYIDSSCHPGVKSGDKMTGRLNKAGNNISNVSNPISNQDSATKSYVNTLGVLKLTKAGDAMTEALSIGNNKIINLGNPTNPQDAVTKFYVTNFGIPSFVVTSDIIPTTTSSDIVLYTLLSGKTMANGKIVIAGFFVEWVTGEWFDCNCGEFIDNWTFFNLLVEDQQF